MFEHMVRRLHLVGREIASTGEKQREPLARTLVHPHHINDVYFFSVGVTIAPSQVVSPMYCRAHRITHDRHARCCAATGAMVQTEQITVRFRSCSLVNKWPMSLLCLLAVAAFVALRPSGR